MESFCIFIVSLLFFYLFTLYYFCKNKTNIKPLTCVEVSSVDRCTGLTPGDSWHFTIHQWPIEKLYNQYITNCIILIITELANSDSVVSGICKNANMILTCGCITLLMNPADSLSSARLEAVRCCRLFSLIASRPLLKPSSTELKVHVADKKWSALCRGWELGDFPFSSSVIPLLRL